MQHDAPADGAPIGGAPHGDAPIVLIEQDGRWQDRTAQIASWERTGTGVAVVFAGTDRVFNYGSSRIAVVAGGDRLDPAPIVRERSTGRLKRVECVERFFEAATGEAWIRLGIPKGRPAWQRESELQFVCDVAATTRGRTLLDYLRALATVIDGLGHDYREIDDPEPEDAPESADAPDGSAPNDYLQKKVGLIGEVPADSILGSFLASGALPAPTPASGAGPFHFPWENNRSQVAAVAAAFSSTVSIIEGPPGTGKTQTILALIANAILRGESVAVVSSNNSAIDNVAEKIAAAGLGFIAARLGRRELRQRFFSRQTGAYPAELGEWRCTGGLDSLAQEAERRQAELASGYDAETRLAELRETRRLLETEFRHHDALPAAVGRVSTEAELAVATWGSERYLRFVLELEDHAEQPWWRRAVRWFALGGEGRRVRASLAPSDPLARRNLWYAKRIEEVDQQIAERSTFLAQHDWASVRREAQEASLTLLRASLAERFDPTEERPRFDGDQLWKGTRSADFLTEYPVVLSTTHTLKGALRPDLAYDLVIVDEASQVDLLTGVLAMSCARRLVVVGDDKQLPRVLSSAGEKRLDPVEAEWADALSEAPWLSATRHSLLTAVRERWGEAAPATLLREHYRCDPVIAGFINERFYDGDLIVMTPAAPADARYRPMTAVIGYGRPSGRVNHRQVEIIDEEILPDLDGCSAAGIGIIAPYRAQVRALRDGVGRQRPRRAPVEISTVHSFQGREKQVIILSAVEGGSEFTNNPRLINVAVSRARRRFVLVADEADGKGNSLVADLIRYIGYHDHEAIRRSQIRSIFELLAAAQQEALAAIRTARGRRAERESPAESLVAEMLDRLLDGPGLPLMAYVQEYPLVELVGHVPDLTEAERRLAENGSRIDFLIYERLGRTPLLVVEVDGWSYHRPGTRQAERDALKDSALRKAGYRVLRLGTEGSREPERIREALASAGYPLPGEA